jgi:hypothetical protein
MSEPIESGSNPLGTVDPELRQLLGLFDAPAFARRGQDVEYALGRLHGRCCRERSAMLEMVRLRLRQWAGSVAGPDDWPSAFAAPIAALWPLAAADPPAWSDQPAPPRRRRAVARDLVASVQRFNRRWTRFLAELNLEPVNNLIDQYNRYYLLEKECCLGSSRLAARHFIRRAPLTRGDLLADYPTLPVPELT